MLPQLPLTSPACSHFLHQGDRYECALGGPCRVELTRLSGCPTFHRARRKGEVLEFQPTVLPAALVTGGIGDAIAVESMLTEAERDRLETLYLACPAWREVADLLDACRFPRLRRQVVLPSEGAHKDAASVRRATGLPPGVSDWSISSVFYQGRRLPGRSSLLERRVARISLPEGRYAVVVPHSTWGRWEGRGFDKADWAAALTMLEAQQLTGIVLGRESVEIVKGAAAYIGVDTWASVLAAQLLPAEALTVKSVRDHCHANAARYFAPHTQFPFLRRTVAPPPVEAITVTVPQGIGDIFWIYQLLSPHYKTIHFRVAQIGEASVKQRRAHDWLKLLPKCGDVTGIAMTDEQYAAMAEAELPVPVGVAEAVWSANRPLESGRRLESIGKVEETVPLPVEECQLPFGGEPYWCLYVSGSTFDEGALRDTHVWTADQWVEFARGLAVQEWLPRHCLIIGAGYDAEAMSAMRAASDSCCLVMDERPERLLHLLRHAKLFVGYQSGLNVMADQLDVPQVMLYFPHLEDMIWSWPKRRNIDGGVYRASTMALTPREVLDGLR